MRSFAHLRRLLRRREAPAALGRGRGAVRVGRLAPADPPHPPPGLPGLPARPGAARAGWPGSASRSTATRTGWRSGPFTIQPAEIAKLAIVLWAANVYARKERRLRELAPPAGPGGPGLFAVIGLVLVGRDLGTALVLFAILLGMLWVVGAPLRLFGLSLSVLGVAAVALAAIDSERLERITNFGDPFKDYLDAGWQPAHGLYALSSGGWFGQGIGAVDQKWGDLPEAHTDYIFAILGEELGLVGTLLVVRALLHASRSPSIRVAAAHRGPVRPLRHLRHRGLAARPDDDQRRHGARGAPGHRHPAAARLLRRLGPAALPRRPRLLIGFARREPGAAAALAARRRDRSAGLAGLLRAARFVLMRVLLAGGGSAGHTSPLLATADALRRLDPAVEITCLGTREGLEARWSPRPGCRWSSSRRCRCRATQCRPVPGTPTRLRAARAAALEVVDRIRPDVVVGFGGYVSVPAYLAARKRGVPIVVHEGNALPGIANKLGARMTTHVATSFPDIDPVPCRLHRAADPPDDLDPGPVRAAGRGARGASASTRTCPTLLVTGGSQGARPHQRSRGRCGHRPRERAASRCCTWSGPRTRLDVPTGRRALRRARLRRPDGPRLRRGRRRAVPRRQQHGHRGRPASGLPAIFVPLPIGNGEQALNARPVVDAGGGLLVADAALTPEWVAATVPACWPTAPASTPWARRRRALIPLDADDKLGPHHRRRRRLGDGPVRIPVPDDAPPRRPSWVASTSSASAAPASPRSPASWPRAASPSPAATTTTPRSCQPCASWASPATSATPPTTSATPTPSSSPPRPARTTPRCSRRGAADCGSCRARPASPR